MLDEPWSSVARSMKAEGMVEKSVEPSIGLEMSMPFQLTRVCAAEVPRKAMVLWVARP